MHLLDFLVLLLLFNEPIYGSPIQESDRVRDTANVQDDASRENKKDTPSIMVKYNEQMVTYDRKNQKKTSMKQLVDLARESLEWVKERKLSLGLQVTDSGLSYRILHSLNTRAPKPTIHDQVRIQYVGRIGTTGIQFESSADRDSPSVFAVNDVIPGWSEAFQLMQVGDKFELFIAPQLGFGLKGVDKLIPPNTALHFDIELLEILTGASKVDL